jgi:FkbM family methyltransferase
MNPLYSWLIDNLNNKTPKLRRLIMKTLYKDKDILIKLFDQKLLINSIKENGYLRASQLCETSSLLRDEISVILNISALLVANDTFVDVGANIGIFSSLIARYFPVIPNLEIYAFEANPDTYERLKINAEQYGFNAYNIAISDQKGELDFVEGVVSHVFTTLENSSRYNLHNKTIKIACQRLDKIEITGNSIILKIDVEGQELQVLKGASSWFDHKRIKVISHRNKEGNY